MPPKPPWPPLPCTPLGTALLMPPSLQEGTASVPSCAVAPGPTWLSQFWKRNRMLSSVQPREPNVSALGGSPGPWLLDQTERVGESLSSQTLLPFQTRRSPRGDRGGQRVVSGDGGALGVEGLGTVPSPSERDWPHMGGAGHCPGLTSPPHLPPPNTTTPPPPCPPRAAVGGPWPS